MGKGIGDEASSIASADLKEALKRSLGESRSVPPLGAESYLRMSAMASLCPREETLVTREGLFREDVVGADLKMIFSHGHALHWAFQNILLPDIGILRGLWSCIACGERYGAQGIPGEGTVLSPVEAAVARPEECEECRGKEFLFHEYDLIDHEYRITGHSDGFLEMPGMPGLGVFEGKSINPRGAWEVRSCPKLDHVIQAQGYMWLTGLQWGKLVYWDKAGQGLGSIIEHTLERDEETISLIKSAITAIWDGVERGVVPERICEKRHCKRANACVVADACFEEPNG